MIQTLQFAAYTADVEGGDIQTLAFPGITNIKGVRIIASAGVANGTAVVHARVGIGYWDLTTQRAMSIQASDNDLTPNTGTRHDTATLIYFINTTNTNIVAEAEGSSVGDGFVKIHWSDYPGTALLLEVTVYYGPGVSCNLHDFTGNATAGLSLTKTGLAFAPNALEVLSVGGIAFAADASFTGSALGLGFGCLQADGSTRMQGCIASVARNLPTGGVAQAGQVLRDDAIAQKLTIAADGTVTAGASWSIQSYTGDGYEVRTDGVSEALTFPVFAIRFGAGERWVGVPALVTSSAGVKSIATSPAFKPGHVDCLASGLDAKNTVQGAAGTGDLENFSIGGGRPENHCVAIWRNTDGITPSTTRAEAGVELVAAAWRADLDALTGTGFDVEITAASTTTDRFSVFRAIQWPAAPGWIPATRRFRRQLARM